MHRIRYSDQDSVVHLYSRDFGRASYLVANRRKRGTLSQALLQPLSIVEFEADHKGSRQLQRIREMHCLYAFRQLPSDPVKNTLSMFLAEVLYRVLAEAEPNEALFQFLSQSIQLLDLNEAGTANFHLVFLLKLSLFLGISPNMEGKETGGYFDLQAGGFVLSRPYHNAWLGPAQAQMLARLMEMNYENMHLYAFGRGQRVEILRRILDYYRLHLAEFPEIRSLEVMQELFADSK